MLAEGGQVNKPIHYLVLIAIDSLTEADLLTRTDELKRILPVEGPQYTSPQLRVQNGWQAPLAR